MSPSSLRITTIVLLISLLAGAAFGMPLVMADEDDSPPPEPANYYGELEIDGEPAAANLTIEVELNGEPAGSITTGENGTFGGSDVADEKLLVSGEHGDEGESVEFYVEGAGYERTLAEPVITWEPNDLRSIQLQADPERASVDSLDINVADDTLSPDEESTWNATAVFEDGTETEVTESADVQSSDNDVATVENEVITAIDQGTTDVEVSFEGITETVSISVTSDSDDDDDDETDSDASNGGGGAGGAPAPPPYSDDEEESDEDGPDDPVEPLTVSVEVTTDSVLADDDVSIPIGVRNDDASEVDTSVDLWLNDEHVTSTNVSVPANGSETIEFETQIPDTDPVTIVARAGNVVDESTVSVTDSESADGEVPTETPSDVDTPTEEIDETPDTPATEEEPVEENIPGFSAVKVLMAIGIILFISSRRR